ncbi:HNH endonuclease [Deinococcus sp. PEB2-63]
MQDTPGRTCTKCGTTYPATLEYFCANKRSKTGLDYACKRCESRRAKTYREDPEVQGRLREQSVQWRTANADHLRDYRQDHAEESRTYTRRWARKNPEQVRNQARNRRARKKAAPGTHTADDIQRQLKSQQGKCYWCAQPLSEYHVDHIVALSKGGGNGPGNLCCACPDCNLRKHNKMPWDFAGRLL